MLIELIQIKNLKLNIVIWKKNVNFNFNERYFLRINASSLLSNHSICYQKKYSIEEIKNIKNFDVNIETNDIIGYSVVAFFMMIMLKKCIFLMILMIINMKNQILLF